MSDDPRQTRAGSIARMVADLRDAFIAAGVDPADPDSRDRFGEDHRWVRDLRRRSEHRHEWLAKVSGAVITAALVAGATALAPLLLQWLHR